MIEITNVDVQGFEPAIRGMRNPLNSWEKSDSVFYDQWSGEYHDICGNSGPYDSDRVSASYELGENDLTLMKKLAAAGREHSKYRRMIAVWMDIKAPLYWWKEFDTYKVGTVSDSCSTMHKIAAKEFELEDFSHEHLLNDDARGSLTFLDYTCDVLNYYRSVYIETKNKKYWWQLIQLLPSSYNQKRTIMLSYEVLAKIYHERKNHKLDEWREFCEWIKTLPYAKELIVCEEET